MNNTLLIRQLHTSAIQEECFNADISTRRVGEILSYAVLPTSEEEVFLGKVFGNNYEPYSISSHLEFLTNKVKEIAPWGSPTNGQLMSEIVANLRSLRKILQEKGVQ